jgi:Tol biopolymer transport system component
MLQWLPGSRNEILWNDRQGDRYVCHILDVESKNKRTVGYPIYSVSPDGRWAIAPDFRRLADVRPGYGYAGVPDPNRQILAPDNTGIFRIDLETGEQKLLISVADVARLPYSHADLSKHKHWFNHLLISPDGSRFTFLHRFQAAGEKWHKSRMITANADGSDVRVLIDSGLVSHFIWRDPEHILAYAKVTPKGEWGFFLFRDNPERTVEQIAKSVVTGDGHCSYSPDKRWVLYDTYPDKAMIQHIYLYDLVRQERVDLGEFRQPKQYWNSPPEHEWRCDLHPRFSRDGRSVVFDSPHSGQGRQLHLLDTSRIVI